MVAQLIGRLGAAAARRLGGKNASGTMEEAIMRGAEGSKRLKNILRGTEAAAVGGSALSELGDSGEKAYKERTSELASSKQREKTKAAAREAKAEAETQDVKRPYMAPAEAETQDVKRPYMAPAKVEKPVARKRAESASYNPPPSSVREDYLKQEDSSPVSDAGYITYESSSDDIHPESSSMKYSDKSSEQTPFSDRPIDEAATSLNRMGKYAKGGGIGRGMGKALRGGGCVMKRAGGGKVMSRGVAKRGFGKEIC